MRQQRKVLQIGNSGAKWGFFCEEDDCYLDKASPSKRAHRQGDRDEDLVVTSDQVK